MGLQGLTHQGGLTLRERGREGGSRTQASGTPAVRAFSPRRASAQPGVAFTSRRSGGLRPHVLHGLLLPRLRIQ